MQTVLPGKAPVGFERVSNGWDALMSEGVELHGVTFKAPNDIGAALENGEIEQAIIAWKAWINVMGNSSLFNGLVRIFSLPNPPGRGCFANWVKCIIGGYPLLKWATYKY